jgi:hypothetical protein
MIVVVVVGICVATGSVDGGLKHKNRMLKQK